MPHNIEGEKREVGFSEIERASEEREREVDGGLARLRGRGTGERWASLENESERGERWLAVNLDELKIERKRRERWLAVDLNELEISRGRGEVGGLRDGGPVGEIKRWGGKRDPRGIEKRAEMRSGERKRERKREEFYVGLSMVGSRPGPDPIKLV